MGLNTAGLTALLDQGANAPLYVAVGDGPLSTDQVSGQRRQITWGAAADEELTATNVPFTFTGTGGADATYMLFFSAATAGTFYGFAELDGDQVFNAGGQFQITELILTGSDPEIVEAPTAPFESGTEVGVPTGTSLTTRTSLGSPTGSGTYEIIHPVSGESAVRPVQIWEDIEFTQALSSVSPADPNAGAFLFLNCRFDVPETSWCIEVDQGPGVADQMIPSVIFDHCSFQGNGDSNIAAAVNFSWLIACDIEGMLSASPASGAADGLQGAAYTVVIDSNIIAGTNEDLPDPHSDGLQCTGTGHSTIFHCWLSAGGSAGANAAARYGTEFGPIDVVQIYYCALDDGGYALQMRGDAGGGDEDLTNVEIVGCRWTEDAEYGPVDFFNVIDPLWVDNRFFSGEEIPEPSP